MSAPEVQPALPPELDDDPDPPVRVPLGWEDWAGVIVMGLLTAITFGNVVVRYFTDESFAWTEEVSVFLMIVLALVGSGAAIARERHIRIEYFLDGGGPQRRQRLRRFSALVSALFFVGLAVLSTRLVWDHFRYEETSPGIGVPSWWYSIWLPILSLAIAARAFGVWWRLRGDPADAAQAGPGAAR